MSIFDRFRKSQKEEIDNSVGIASISDENNIEKSFNIDVGKGGTAHVSYENVGNTYNSVTYNAGGKQVTNNARLKAKKSEIKSLMHQGKTLEALEAYQKIQNELLGDELTVDDTFYIMNGIYNCKVNLQSKPKELDEIKDKIELLSEAKDYYRFVYLNAIRNFNDQDFKEAIRLCDESIALNEEYDKPIILKIIAQGIEGIISYEDGLLQLDEYITKYEKDTNELSNIHCSKADLAFMTKHPEEAVEFYGKANEIQKMLHYELGVGLSYFKIATKASAQNGYITFDKIDFEMLSKAVGVFENILSQMKEYKDVPVLKSMMPFYLNALEIIDEPQKVIDATLKTEFLAGLDTEDIVRMKAEAELKLGKTPSGSLEGISPTDKLKLDIKGLMFHGDYTSVVEKISPLIDSLFVGDEQILAFYLISLGKTNASKFIDEFKKYSEGRENEVKFKLIWIQHLEHNVGVEEAKLKVDELMLETHNSIVVNDAYRFYKNNGYDKEALEITTAVIEGKYSVLKSDFPQFIGTYFFALLENKDYEALDRFYDNTDIESLPERIRLQIEIEYLKVKGEVLKVAEKCMQYHELTNDNKIAIKGAYLYINGGEIDKGIEILNRLIKDKNEKTSDAYIQLAQAYVLKEENDKAFDMAFEAKEADKDSYKSESHRFYVSMGLRVNRVDDSFKYMMDFHEEFPKNGWIKPITLEMNEDGTSDENVVEKLQSVTGDRTPFDEMRKLFFSHQIGISSYMKILNEMKIDNIFAELRYFKKKIKIATGYTQHIQEEAKLVGDNILVDSLSLYVLEEAEIMKILDEFKNVYILYSTIEFINSLLIINESRILRRVLSYIHNAENVMLVPICNSMIVEDKRILSETCHYLGYSQEMKIPYLCVDFAVKAYSDKADYVVDISGMIRGLVNNDIRRISNYSIYINKLLKRGYYTISFNAIEMRDTIISLEDFSKLEDELNVFLCMDRNSDYDSHIRVYNFFLNFIENAVTEDIYDRCVVRILQYMNHYLGKTQYYYYKLVDLAKLKKEEEPFFITNNIVVEFLNYSAHIESNLEDVFYRTVTKTMEYQKLYKIITPILQGVFLFMSRYKDDHKKVEKMTLLVRENMDKLDKQFIDNMVEEIMIVDI